MDTHWKPLSHQDPVKIRQTIAYLHHAAQLVAAVGNSLLPKAKDDSQSTLEWLPGLNALTGQMIGNGFRAALRYLPFEILVLDDENRIREGESVSGRTKQELLIWLQRAVTRVGGAGKQLKPIDHYKIPDHQVEHGQKFPEINSAIHHELINFRSNADWVLNEVSGLYKDVTPVRTWPHHFDTATVLTMSRNKAGKATKNIGIGWAVPDEKFPEPYFYVNHWTNGKAPDYSSLPPLEGAGQWHLDSWKGAVLKSADLIEHRQSDDQQQEALQFFRSAIRSTKSFL